MRSREAATYAATSAPHARRWRSAPSASPPLLPLPVTATIRRPATPPSMARVAAAICRAALSMSASSGTSNCSDATRSTSAICAAVATGTSRAAMAGSDTRLISADGAKHDLPKIEADLVDAERVAHRLRRAAQHLPDMCGVRLGRARAHEPGLRLDMDRAARFVGHVEAGLLDELAPAGDGVLAHVRRVARHLERVDEAVECLIVGCVVIGEDEPAAGAEHAMRLAEGGSGVAEMMRGETACDDVKGRVEERERLGRCEHEHRVRHALPSEQRARALGPPFGRVGADRQAHPLPDAPHR